ncbi:hypothetical protein SS50377_22538 [Spironucleus salmonicida]|uniref:Uncharacterized protein n=1 Tax=Spironucleus salmonicida TaxID=348837 RepID=V6LBY4_9EUKA|nr:hypothetical protein SS50377_22538 [Spironucleus salmonicida]|eukprot:EST41972.1 Hypothetical protein SS50377_18277 [Spironucleus salmonicida]
MRQNESQSSLRCKRQEIEVNQKIGSLVVDKLDFKSYQKFLPDFSYNYTQNKQRILKSVTKPIYQSSTIHKEFVVENNNPVNQGLLKNYTLSQNQFIQSQAQVFQTITAELSDDNILHKSNNFEENICILRQETNLKINTYFDTINIRQNQIRTLSPLQQKIRQRNALFK